jgi:hypothetical protein
VVGIAGMQGSNGSECEAVEVLRARLASVPPGRLAGEVAKEVVKLLAAAWGCLKGSSDEATTGEKLLRNTVTNIDWQPLILTLVIERHPGVSNLSTRDKLHTWKADLGRRTATIVRKATSNVSRWPARSVSKP